MTDSGPPVTAAPGPPPSHPRGTLAALALCSAAIALLFIAIPMVRGIPPLPGTLLGSALVAVLSFWLVALGARLSSGPLIEVLATLGAGGIWWLAGSHATRVPEARHYAMALASAAFLLACFFLGKLISRIIREPALIIPVSLVTAMADIFTVFWGPTGHFLERAPSLVARLSLNIPAAGSAAGAEGAAGLLHVATIGPGDFIFLALFMSLAVRFGFPFRRTLVALALGSIAGVVATFCAPAALLGMPLLPYLAGAFLIANLPFLRMTPRERRDMAIGLLFIAVLFVAAALALHSH